MSTGCRRKKVGCRNMLKKKLLEAFVTILFIEHLFDPDNLFTAARQLRVFGLMGRTMPISAMLPFRTTY